MCMYICYMCMCMYIPPGARRRVCDKASVAVGLVPRSCRFFDRAPVRRALTPNLPTKIIPTKIA